MSSNFSAIMVGIRRFEITIVSAEHLPDVRRLGRMKTYATVSLNGATKSTHVDAEGHTNPRWNSRFIFTAEESSLQRSELTVVVNLFCERFLGDKYIGQVRIPVKELFDMGIGSHKTLSYTVYGTANASLNIHYWFEEKLVPAPPPSQRDKTSTHTETIQVFNYVVIQSVEAPKTAPPAQPKVAHLKSLSPPKTITQGGTNGAALQAAKTMPRVETNLAPLKASKTAAQGETNGAALKPLQAPKTVPWGGANTAPLKSMEAPKSAALGENNGTTLKLPQDPKTLHPVKPLQAPLQPPQDPKTLHPVKPLQESKTLHPVKPLQPPLQPPQDLKTLHPVKPLQAPMTVPHATKTLPHGETNTAPMKALEAQKGVPSKETNGAVLKPSHTQVSSMSLLKTREASKAAA